MLNYQSINHNDLGVFLVAAKHKNFTRAAAELNVSPSAISHTIKSLESMLDVRLLNRTTRSISLTPAGEALFNKLSPAYLDINNALEDLSQYSGKQYGSLKLNAGLPSCQMILIPLIAEFQQIHPEIKIELIGNDALVDMVLEECDAGIRFGESLAQDMIALPISKPLRSVVVATPEYLAQMGSPRHPQELTAFTRIAQRFPTGTLYKWEFEQQDNFIELLPSDHLIVNDMRLALDAALAGIGLAYVFEDMAQPYLQRQQLVTLLDDWCPAYPGQYIYYPSRRQVPFGLHKFIEFARSKL